MKLWKSSILFVSVAVMLLSSIAVSADKTEHDLTGDVWHFEYDEGLFIGWEPVSRPNVDITELSYAVNEDRVTLTLKVVGTITNSELISFWFSLNTDDSSYTIMWINGELLLGMGTNTEGSSQMDMDPEISVDGGTLSATFDVVGTFTTGVELTGYSQEFTNAGDLISERWQDWVPDDESSDGQGDDDDDDDDDDTTPGGDDDDDDDDDDDTIPGGNSNIPPTTPGFETIAVIGALAVALILLRKRK